jgi:hypothetical protein
MQRKLRSANTHPSEKPQSVFAAFSLLERQLPLLHSDALPKIDCGLLREQFFIRIGIMSAKQKYLGAWGFSNSKIYKKMVGHAGFIRIVHATHPARRPLRAARGCTICSIQIVEPR